MDDTISDIVPHREQSWRPLAEVAATLAAIGPDLQWAEEFRKQRLDLGLENPWEATR